MTRGGEKASSQQTSPKAVVALKKSRREREPEIENLKFVNGRSRGHHFRPPARNRVKDQEETQQRPSHIKKHLDYIGPDDRRHAAFERIEERQTEDHGDRGGLSRPQHNRDHDGYREYPHAFRQRAQQQECSSRESPDPPAKTAIHQFISGEHLTPKIVRKEEHGDDNAPEQISQNQLQEGEVTGKRQRGRPDHRQSTRFSRDNREGNRPPWRAPAAQEIILESRLFFLELRPEPGDKQQVGSDYPQVHNAHGNVDDSMPIASHPKRVYSDAGNNFSEANIYIGRKVAGAEAFRYTPALRIQLSLNAGRKDCRQPSAAAKAEGSASRFKDVEFL